MTVTSLPESRIIWLWIIKPATWRILSTGKHRKARQTIRKGNKKARDCRRCCVFFILQGKQGLPNIISDDHNLKGVRVR
jgi:hypothetical protein